MYLVVRREDRSEGESFLDGAEENGSNVKSRASGEVGQDDDDDDFEELGTSLIQSSLADQSPRWRMHDSQVGAVRDDGENAPRAPSDPSDESDESDESPPAQMEEGSKNHAAAGLQFGLEE